MRFHVPLILGLISATAQAADPTPGVLPPEEFAAGWVSLFDGATDFGWAISGKAEVKDGHLILGRDSKSGATTTAELKGEIEYEIQFRGGWVRCLSEGKKFVSTANSDEWATYRYQRTGTLTEIKTTKCQVVRDQIKAIDSKKSNAEFTLEGEPRNPIRVRSVRLRFLNPKPFMNGHDLTGWKRFTGNPKQELSKFDVTKAGELHVTNGPGDLQTEKSFKDFCLHLECKSNGKALNSGVFFRCLPGVYQQGYEAQIQNGFKDDDRTKPADFGTGAIYRRVPTRRVIPNDNEWFALTVLAVGPRLRTWVNGFPTVDWIDERPANANGRNGLKLDAGPISIQGHDPTTNLHFRNLRITDFSDKP